MALHVMLLARAARRYGPPLAHAAYRRWQAMTPEEKERYRRQMREYAGRGRAVAKGAAGRVRDRGRGGPPEPRP